MSAGLTAFTWTAVEFCANLAVIAYVLAFFGILRVPKPEGNVAEATATRFNGFGSFVSEATGLARSINGAMNPQQEAAVAAAAQTSK
tara:strand:- start:94032 stop:94292 length:261 start_codon:yes stop_codon:yes gene_type:complete